MIRKIKVSAFKSLVDFEIKLGKFNCIIGLNGAGKSSVLQLIGYLSSIFRGDINQWLKQHQWQANEVVSHYFPTRETIDFEIDLVFSGQSYLWKGVYNWNKGFCTSENLFDTDDNILLYRVHQGRFKNFKGFDQKIYFQYSGSILSSLSDEAIPYEIRKVRNYIGNIENHELLSPKVMRTGNYTSHVILDSIGEYLFSYIHHLSSSDKDLLRERLAEYFPQVINIATKTEENGTIAMSITERFYQNSEDDSDQGSDNHIDLITNARHINDGLLRILNLLANQRSESKFQVFDEIENGVNPEITEKLMDGFLRAPQQTLVTTHSPMILNYLDEEDAINSVVFVYKRKDGKTKAKHLFNIPSARTKLVDLAPGEVMVDLYLDRVALEAEQLETKGIL